MKSSTLISCLFAMTATCDAFTIITPQHVGNTNNVRLFASSVVEEDSPVVSDIKNEQEEETQTIPKKAASKKKPAAGGAHKEGVFSPAVKTAKAVLGDKKLNQVRGKAIAMHSNVIGKFVETSDSEFGELVLQKLFELADKDGNGTIEKSELTVALKTLGFDLNDKQINGIFERADVDDSGAIDFDEWKKEAPKTLRTNLIKMAKKNGGEMGFLV